jgi:membrane fusion protein, copper/silver efflux system
MSTPLGSTDRPPRNPAEHTADTGRRRAPRWGLAVALAAVIIGCALWVILARRAASHRASTRTAISHGGTRMKDMAGMADSSRTAGSNPVHFTAEQIRQFGVTFGTADERTLSTDVRAAGTVMFDETGLAQVTPKFSGYIDRLYVNATGQPVRRGQPVAAIYSPDLIAAQEELLLAARLDTTVGRSTVPGVPSNASDLLGAAKRRLRLWDISEAQIDDVLTTGTVQRTLTLYAPVSGVVTDKKVVQGQSIQAGEPLVTVADLSDVWVDAELREVDAGLVRVGDRVQLDFTAYPGVPFAGRVSYVYPTVAMESRTLRARVVIPNRDGRLRPGMYATVYLAAPSRRALTVPTSAVVRTGERTLVFVDLGNGQFRPQAVETGRVAGDFTEILTGVAAGQRVVTSAQFLLDSESNLGEVMKSMISIGAGMGGRTATPKGDMPKGDMPKGDMPGMNMDRTQPNGDTVRHTPVPRPAAPDAPSMKDKGADVRGMPGMANPPSGSH